MLALRCLARQAEPALLTSARSQQRRPGGAVPRDACHAVAGGACQMPLPVRGAALAAAPGGVGGGGDGGVQQGCGIAPFGGGDIGQQ